MEEIKDEKQFKRGMNHGYLLAQHRPDLLDGILKANKKWDDFIEGLAHGGAEYRNEREKEMERIKDLQNIRNKTEGRNLEKDR